jgi:hypothetical protein
MLVRRIRASADATFLLQPCGAVEGKDFHVIAIGSRFVADLPIAAQEYNWRPWKE